MWRRLHVDGLMLPFISLCLRSWPSNLFRRLSACHCPQVGHFWMYSMTSSSTVPASMEPSPCCPFATATCSTERVRELTNECRLADAAVSRSWGCHCKVCRTKSASCGGQPRRCFLGGGHYGGAVAGRRRASLPCSFSVNIHSFVLDGGVPRNANCASRKLRSLSSIPLG